MQADYGIPAPLNPEVYIQDMPGAVAYVQQIHALSQDYAVSAHLSTTCINTLWP